MHYFTFYLFTNFADQLVSYNVLLHNLWDRRRSRFYIRICL